MEFRGGSVVKNLPPNAGDMGLIDPWVRKKDPLEKGMATYPGVLAWEIPWTEEPDGLQSVGCKRVRYDPVMKQQHHSSHFWISENLESPVMLTGFSRQEYQGGMLCPPPGNLPNPGRESCVMSTCFGRWFLTTSAAWAAHGYAHSHVYISHIILTILYHNYIIFYL